MKPKIPGTKDGALLVEAAKEINMTYRDGPNSSPRSFDRICAWIAAALGAAILIIVVAWAYSGGTSHFASDQVPSGPTGQASSATGSSTLGAPR